MRVLEVGKYYPPQRGGMERVLASLCEGLVARGHAVRAIVAAPGRETREEKMAGVGIVRLANWGQLRSVPVTPGLFGRLRRELRDFDPDVVHLHLPHPLGVLARRWVGGRPPLVVTYHSDIVRQRWLARLLHFDRHHVLGRAIAVHVSSEALRDESATLRRHRDRCRVIPFGIDADAYREPDPLRLEQWRQRLGSEFLLFVGRLVYYKGMDVLLEALRETTLPLAVAGDGPMREEWETLARVLGLGHQVHFLGDVSDESLLALLHAAKIFVFPSTHPSETFGLAQLEAMAAGLPVVAARASGGVASLHEAGRTARIVAPHDVAALREALIDLWEDDEARRDLAAAAQSRVRAFFDADRSLDRLEDLLVQAASGRITAP